MFSDGENVAYMMVEETSNEGVLIAMFFHRTRRVVNSKTIGASLQFQDLTMILTP